MSGFLDGKRLLITGVITEQSLGFGVAKYAQEQGAEVVLTGFGRMSLVERIAKKLPTPAPVIELDATDPEQLAGLEAKVREHVDGIDGVLHAIAYAPPSALGGNFLNTPWEDVATALQVELKDAVVRAEGDLDFRGTLGVAKDAPVGFREIRLRFDLDTEAPEEQKKKLIELTERYCVVLQTIRKTPPVNVSA